MDKKFARPNLAKSKTLSNHRAAQQAESPEFKRSTTISPAKKNPKKQKPPSPRHYIQSPELKKLKSDAHYSKPS
jgi:hypothetical protein